MIETLAVGAARTHTCAAAHMSAACQPGFRSASCGRSTFFLPFFRQTQKPVRCPPPLLGVCWRQADGGVTLVRSLALKEENKITTNNPMQTHKQSRASPPFLPALPSIPSSHSDICCPPLSPNTPRTWEVKWPVEAERVGCVFRCIGCDGPEAIDTRRVITPRSDCLSSSPGPSISHGH